MKAFQNVSAGMMPHSSWLLKMSPIPDTDTPKACTVHIGMLHRAARFEWHVMSCHVVIMRRIPSGWPPAKRVAQEGAVTRSNCGAAGLPAPGRANGNAPAGLAAQGRASCVSVGSLHRAAGIALHFRIGGFALKWAQDDKKYGIRGALTRCSSHPGVLI